MESEKLRDLNSKRPKTLSEVESRYDSDWQTGSYACQKPFPKESETYEPTKSSELLKVRKGTNMEKMEVHFHGKDGSALTILK